MSACRLVATITSSVPGFSTMRVVIASTSSLSVRTSGNCCASSAKISSHMHHAVALGVRLGDERQRRFGRARASSKAKRMIRSQPVRVKIATSVPTSSGRPRCTRPPAPAYSPSVFSRTTTQSRSAGPTSRERALDARQQARRADVGVLVEALADREAQAPERDVVGDVGRADGAEVDRIERPQLLEAVRRHHPAGARGSSAEPHVEARRPRARAPARAAASAASTSSPAAITSWPMPSPPIAAILCLATACPSARLRARSRLRGRAAQRQRLAASAAPPGGLDKRAVPCSKSHAAATASPRRCLPSLSPTEAAMSAPPQAKGEPITDRRQLIEYLEAGCKPKGDWRIGTEHEKFGYTHDDLRPLPYEGERSVRALLEGLAARFGWQPLLEDGPADRAAARPRQHHARAGRPVRALGRAGQDPARDLLRGPRASRPGQDRGRAARHRHARAGLPAQVAARRDPLDAQGPLRDHARVHAEEGRARPRHDAAHLHDPGQPRLRVRGRHGQEVPGRPRAAAGRDRAVRQLAVHRGPAQRLRQLPQPHLDRHRPRPHAASCRSCSRTAWASSATSSTRSTCRCTSSTATAATSTRAARASATS